MSNAISDAERSVLGSALIDSACLPVVCGEMVDEDFTSAQTREVFKAIKSLWSSESAVDLVTLSTELELKGKLERTGGMDFLTDLVTFVPTSANVRYYIESVQSARKARTFIAGMKKAVSEAGSGEDAYVDTARSVLSEVGSIGSSGVVRIEDCLPEVTNRLGDNSRGIPTGFRLLDAYTRGLYPGRLYIIAARPGIGKTALASNISANLGRMERTVLFCSLEMSAVEVSERINLSEAMIDPYGAYRGESKAVNAILDTQSKISKWKLYIDDRASLTVDQIIAQAYKVKQSAGKLDCIVIDYLQLIRTPVRKNSTRTEDLGMITRSLKILSREIECPVVVLSQLSRQSVGRRPVVSDLRESGAIEQDADVILMLHREDESPECKETTLIIGKNRHGRTGDIDLVWNPAWTRYTDEAFKDVQIPKGVFDE
ncbi:MAG: replicative DNA helicase [Christensenella sp.]|nr:replicative DNA helicase [Christensenella sp.]